MSLDAFGGVMIDSQGELAVQSLMEIPGNITQTELLARAAFLQGPPTEITLDEDDVFQCGKCKKIFTSFQLFMFHKTEHKSSAKFLGSGLTLALDTDLDPDLENTGLEDESPDLEDHQDELSQHLCEQQMQMLQEDGDGDAQTDQVPSQVLQYAELGDSAFDGLSSDMRMLQDADPMSFSMEQGVLSITSTELPEGTYISTSMGSLHSVNKQIQEDDNASRASATWLLTNKDTDSNLNLVTGYGDDRSLFLSEKKYVVEDSKKMTPSLEFNNDDILQDVTYAVDKDYKEPFLNDSSMSTHAEGNRRVLLPNGEFVLKNNMDYMNSGDLLAEFEKVEQQVLIDEQASEPVTVSVLEVPILSCSSQLEQSAMQSPLDTCASSEMPMDMSVGVLPLDMTTVLPEIPTSLESNIQTELRDPIEPLCEPLREKRQKKLIQEETCNNERGSRREKKRKNKKEKNKLDKERRIVKNVKIPKLSKESDVTKGNEVTWMPRPLKLKCDYCDKRFAKQFDLSQHQRSHTGEKPFQCVVCGRAFAQKSNVKKHLKTHKVWPNGMMTLPKNIVQKIQTKKIDFLGKNINSGKATKCKKEELNNAVKSSEIEGTVEFTEKPRELVGFYNNLRETNMEENSREQGDSHSKSNKLLKSTQLKGDKSLSNLVESEIEEAYIIDNSYICQFCEVSYDTYFELKTHLKSHQNEKVYFCSQKDCQKMFSDIEPFVEHMKMHDSQEACYRCHVCKETFKTLSALGLHQYCHSPEDKASLKSSGRRLACPVCRSRFVTLEAMEHHVMTASHNHPCPECNRVFTCERNLRRHLNTHSTVCPFVCNECGKSFKTEAYLNAHLTMHSDERPFTCDHCPAAFSRKDRLSRHTLIHQDSKRIKCPFHTNFNCAKEFTRKDKLNIHVTRHLKSGQLLQCQICKNDFKNLALFEKHHLLCNGDALLQALVDPKVKRMDKDSREYQFNETREALNKNELPQGNNCGTVKTEPGKLSLYEILDTPTENKQKTSKTVACKVLPRPRASRQKINVEEINVDKCKQSAEERPTIEVIVMPLSLNLQTELGNGDCTIKKQSNVSDQELYHQVIFPIGGAEFPVNLLTGNEAFLSRLNCDNDGGLSLLHADQQVVVFSAPNDLQKL